MLVQATYAAIRQAVSPAMRAILWKSLALTIGLLVVVWAALTRIVAWLIQDNAWSEGYPFIDPLAAFLAGAGLFFGLVYFLPAVTAVVAGFFLDDAAEIVERTDFPADPPGRGAPIGTSIWQGTRFAGLALLVNLGALAFFFVPVVNVAVFFLANSYLFGREYFELAATRHGSPETAADLRQRHSTAAWGAGGIVAALMLIPFVNLLTPLFAIALMVHVQKRVAAKSMRARTV
ncbi:MAG: sulfate transporter family protein [Salinarimonadaceae bacterium]|nr:MAG: sulfate transporter family protein [Salinarimonadaceae bacterium]